MCTDLEVTQNQITEGEMESIRMWKLEIVSFLSDILQKINELSDMSDKDRRIMHYLFNLYLRNEVERNIQKCELVREFIDKYSFYGLRVLKKEIKQSILEFQS